MNKSNLVSGIIKGIQILELEKKNYNKSQTKQNELKSTKPKNSNNYNNSVNNDSSILFAKDSISNKNTSISSKTKQHSTYISISSNNTNNKKIKNNNNNQPPKNNKTNLMKIKINQKNYKNLPKPGNHKQKNFVIYRDKKVSKKLLSYSKNKNSNTQENIINKVNYFKIEENLGKSVKSEPNRKIKENDIIMKRKLNLSSNNYNVSEKNKLKLAFKRILTENTETSVLKSSLYNSSLDSIIYHDKKLIHTKENNNSNFVKKNIMSKKSFIISKDVINKDKDDNNIIIKKIEQKCYNSNNIKNQNSKEKVNNNYLRIKENQKNHKINISNSFGAIKCNNNSNLRNISKNGSKIINETVSNNTKMNSTFNNNNNIHRLHSSSKNDNEKGENISILTNKINNSKKDKSNNKYIYKLVNHKEVENDKSPTKNNNKQINIIMIHSNAKNHNNHNNMISTTNNNVNKDKEKENLKRELIKKIRINNYKKLSANKNNKKPIYYNGKINNINNQNSKMENVQKYKIIKRKKIYNNKISNLKNNIIKTCNVLNCVNMNNNFHMTTIKKSNSNSNYNDEIKLPISPKSNIIINKINNESKILSSNNSCENLSLHKIVSIQKIKINKINGINRTSEIINSKDSIENKSHNPKLKKIEEGYSKKSSSHINKSFNIAKNIYISSNNDNKTKIYEKTERIKKVISISCSIKNTKESKTKIKVHKRQSSMVSQGTKSEQTKRDYYQNINNHMIKNSSRIKNVNIINEIWNNNKIKNKFKSSSGKKFFKNEEPVNAKIIINKYKYFLKKYEIEELKEIYKNGELVYYLGEILDRINNSENTFTKLNQSFEYQTQKGEKSNNNETNEEQLISNKSCVFFREGNDQTYHKLKGKFEQNKFNDEEGDYLINIGTQLNYRYEILERLGRGSFGEAIKCYDHKNKNLVCIKIINSQEKFQSQALTEINILSAIANYDINNDSNNVKFYSYFHFRNHICLVFELLGKNLYEYLQYNDFSGLDISIIKNYTIQILFSLLFLRNLNIIHCDLKPENILLCQNNYNQIKIIDFGSSCFENEKLYIYIQSRFYRAPEILLDLGYSYEIDIWSLGCILFELYTGMPLFSGMNEMEQIYLIMETIGTIPMFMIENSPKRKMFFDENSRPLKLKNEDGNIIKPGTKKLKDILKNAPENFIDFISKCLIWNPMERITPDKALFHPFIIENMNGAELYKHKLKVKHIKYGLQNYNVNSTRNKSYVINKDIVRHRGKSCGNNRNNNLPLKINGNEIIYTNTAYEDNEEVKKKFNKPHYSVTQVNNKLNIFGKKKDKSLPLSTDVDYNLKKINTTETYELNYKKILNYKKSKKVGKKPLPKKKSLGRINKNNKGKK